MAAMTDWLERELASHLFGSGTLSKFPIFVALTKNPLYEWEDQDISERELDNAGGYERVYYPPSETNWTDPVGTGGQVSNLLNVTFPEATADWGYVSGVAITTTGTWGSGIVLLKGALSTPRVVLSGDQFRFKAGDIDIYLD